MVSRALCVGIVIALLSTAQGRVMSRCQVVNEVRAFGASSVATWTCIANFESGYDTAAIGGPNSNGTYDHGLWQINDNYWCHNPSNPGLSNDCNIDCAALRVDDITAIWNCSQVVYNRHGFSAWSTFEPFCTNAENEDWTAGC